MAESLTRPARNPGALIGVDGRAVATHSPGRDAQADALLTRGENPSGTHSYWRLSPTLGAIAAAKTAMLTVISDENAPAIAELRAATDLLCGRVRASHLVFLVGESVWERADG